jgi:hypothetical protein
VNDLKERSPIIVIEKGILPGVSTTGYVINGTQGLDFQRSGHEGSPSETGMRRNDDIRSKLRGMHPQGIQGETIRSELSQA